MEATAAGAVPWFGIVLTFVRDASVAACLLRCVMPMKLTAIVVVVAAAAVAVVVVVVVVLHWSQTQAVVAFICSSSDCRFQGPVRVHHANPWQSMVQTCGINTRYIPVYKTCPLVIFFLLRVEPSVLSQSDPTNQWLRRVSPFVSYQVPGTRQRVPRLLLEYVVRQPV